MSLIISIFCYTINYNEISFLIEMYCNISIKHAIMGCFFYVISQQIINQKNKYRKPDSFSTSIILFTLYIVLNPLIPERHHKKSGNVFFRQLYHQTPPLTPPYFPYSYKLVCLSNQFTFCKDRSLAVNKDEF